MGRSQAQLYEPKSQLHGRVGQEYFKFKDNLGDGGHKLEMLISDWAIVLCAGAPGFDFQHPKSMEYADIYWTSNSIHHLLVWANYLEPSCLCFLSSGNYSIYFKKTVQKKLNKTTHLYYYI